MTWMKTGALAFDHLAHTAHVAGDTCMFRTTRSLLGWREGTAAPLWEVVFDGDEMFATKQSVLRGGLLVTVIVRSRAPGVLVAVEPATGAEAWRTELPGQLAENGLCADDSSLYVHVHGTGDRYFVLRVDARDGRVLDEYDAPDGRGLFCGGGRLYVRGIMGEGLVQTAIGESAWAPVDEGRLADMTAAHGQIVYIRALFGQPWEMASLRLGATAPEGRASLVGETTLQVSPLPEPGRALLFKQRELWLVDSEHKGPVWQKEYAEDEEVRSATWTPHGLVVAIKPVKGQGRIEFMEPEWGNELDPLPLGLHDIQWLYWADDRLLASGLEGLESFAWS
jgi:hypothetical protein